MPKQELMRQKEPARMQGHEHEEEDAALGHATPLRGGFKYSSPSVRREG